MKSKKLIGFDCYKFKCRDGTEWYDINEVFSVKELNKLIKEELNRLIKQSHLNQNI
jgi:phage FluMu protein gp41